MKQNEIIFLAGSTGLIGSAINNLLIKKGYNNILSPTHKELDLTDDKKVIYFFKKFKPRYVILAAGRVGGLMENINHPVDFIFENISIQLNVIKAAYDNNVEKLIFFGSSCMYPKFCNQKMSEELLLSSIPESTSLSYALAKLAGVQMCLSVNQQKNNNNFISIIPNSVYGPNDNFDADTGHVLSALLNKIHIAHINKLPKVTLWGSGTPRREFIYSSDVADASIFLLEKDTSNLKLPLNIGSGIDFSIEELSRKIALIVGFKGIIDWDSEKPDGAERKLLDSSRMLEFGWRPKIDLEDGLEKLYKWYIQKNK